MKGFLKIVCTHPNTVPILWIGNGFIGAVAFGTYPTKTDDIVDDILIAGALTLSGLAFCVMVPPLAPVLVIKRLEKKD